MTQALNTLLDLAERERDLALGRLIQSEEAARRLQQQGEQLQAYHAEYRQRHPAQSGRSAGIDVVRCHLQFMQRLEQALSQLLAQQRAADAQVGTLRAELLALETRVATVRKLLERRDGEAVQRAERQEQHRTDEAAQRAAAPLAHVWRGATPTPPLMH